MNGAQVTRLKKWLACLALGFGFASAHTAVTSVRPAAGTVVHAPRSVELNFSEPVDLHFAAVKVYPVGKLKPDVLNARNDQAVRADRAVRFSGMAARLTLPLKGGLAPGKYMVLWRLLSDDGHVVTGQSEFTVR